MSISLLIACHFTVLILFRMSHYKITAHHPPAMYICHQDWPIPAGKNWIKHLFGWKIQYKTKELNRKNECLWNWNFEMWNDKFIIENNFLNKINDSFDLWVFRMEYYMKWSQNNLNRTWCKPQKWILISYQEQNIYMHYNVRIYSTQNQILNLKKYSLIFYHCVSSKPKFIVEMQSV